MFSPPSTQLRKSVPELRQAQRLSKPRTNTSSSDLLLPSQQSESESPLTPSNKTTAYFGDSEPVATSQRGEHLERRSRQNSRHKLRAHLFGSSADLNQHDSSEGSEEGTRSGIADVARGVRDRLSRTASTVSQLPNARRSSLHLHNSSTGSRLSLTPEPMMPDPEETSRIVEEIKEKASNDRLAAYNHVSTPIDENAPELIMTPIRRRSLFTPGLATRTPTDILRKPPPPESLQSQADRDYYFDPSLSQSSPLSRLAALDLADEGRCTPVPRASTPVNSDYTYLGGLRIGTLRVTNGTDSPVPHARISSNTSMLFAPGLPKEEGYFTGSEGKLSDEEDTPQPIHLSPRKSGEVMPLTEGPIGVNRQTADIRKIGRPTLTVQTTPQRSGSPLNYERREPGVSWDEDVNDMPLKNRQSGTCYEASLVSADRASSIAQEYMLELPTSPFSYPNSTFPRISKLEATMQAFEFDTDILDDEDVAASPLGVAGVTKWNSFIEDAEARHAIDESREEAFKILNGEPRPHVKSEFQPQISSTASSNDEHANIVSELSAKPLSKADSGYSSSGSVKSGRKRISSIVGEQDLRPMSLSAQRESVRFSGQREMSQPTMVKSDDRSQSNIVTPKSILVRTSLTVVPKAPSTESAFAPTAQGHSLPTSITISASKTSNVNPVKPRNCLKKTRPLLTPLPVSSITVQSYREVNHTHIPPVPSELVARHAERLQDFPLLEHTFPSLHHTHLGNTSPNSEPDFVPIRFPSPANDSEDAETPPSSPDDNVSCMRTFSWKPRSRFQSDKKSTNNLRTKSLSRQQSLPGQCDFRTTMADYDSFTKSLGGNPYEIARSRTVAGSESTGDEILSHRPQLDTALPRSRSKFGMDGEAASEFARVRSKQKSRSNSRPWTTYDKKFDDRGGIPGKLARPQSFSGYAPPVPALPTPEQVEHTERRLSRWSADASQVLPSPCQSKVPSGLEGEISQIPDTNVDRFAPRFQESLERSCPMSSDSQAPQTFSGSVVPSPPTRKAPEPPVSSERSAVPPPPPTRKAPAPPAPAPPAPSDWLSSNPEAKGSQLALRPLSANKQHPTVTKQASRSFHLPMTPPESLPNSTNASTASLRVLAAQGGHGVAATGSFERLSGRYDGGLSFGYEPGFGLGGSAGTRDGKTGASRKSVDVSRGFGIDLSDIPIFVAHSS
ncbi:MAG: hypothetical protein LQ347_001893 [Umbilicaria vellea]|nr:MAG: hypothetical protein LQ347_001893 [Umbilicaria vellea]